MIKVCQCGKEFSVTQKRLDLGRGKYCSKPCQSIYGGKSIIKNCLVCKVNFTIPPSRIERAKYCSVKCSNEGHKLNKGKTHHLWGGNNISYKALHIWVKRRMGKACKCIKCKSEINVEWANKSHQYKRDLTDWIQLCKKCHAKYDSGKHRGSTNNHFNKRMERI